MSTTDTMPSSCDAPLLSAEKSSARFKEAARNMGGVLTGLGNVVRKTTLGLTLTGLATFLTNTAFITSPANAQTVTLQTDCSTYQPNVLGASGLCEIEKNKLAHQQLNRDRAEEKRLDKDIAMEDVLQACLKQLVAFKAHSPDEFAKFGKITRENACPIAKKLPPQPTAAQAIPSAG